MARIAHSKSAGAIPLGAVHRAKRQIEKMVAQKAGGSVAAISLEPPPSYDVCAGSRGDALAASAKLVGGEQG